MSFLAPLQSRQKCSAAEWTTRVDLAACYRLVELFRMSDLVFNHITAKVPGEEHRYLINHYGLAYEEVTASNLVKIDLEGRIYCTRTARPPRRCRACPKGLSR